MVTKCAKSASVSRPRPSAMFAATESAARSICRASDGFLRFSPFARRSMRRESSCAVCQTRSCRKLLMRHNAAARIPLRHHFAAESINRPHSASSVCSRSGSGPGSSPRLPEPRSWPRAQGPAVTVRSSATVCVSTSAGRTPPPPGPPGDSGPPDPPLPRSNAPPIQAALHSRSNAAGRG